MSAKYIYSSKRNPCPVCGRTKDADCRVTPDEGLVFCHSEINSRKPGEELNEHIYLGENSTGNWGKWVRKSEQFQKQRTPGQEFRYPFTDIEGNFLVEEVRVYQSTGCKKTWISPKGVDTSKLAPYRYLEAIQALKDGAECCFITEGPPKADVLWDLGIPAVAFANGFKQSRDGQWFQGFENRLIVSADRDKPGLEKAEKVLKAYPMAKLLKPCPDSIWWESEWLPESGGFDLRDWLEQLKRQGLDSEQIKSTILAAVEDNPYSKQKKAKTPKLSDNAVQELNHDNDDFTGFLSDSDKGLRYQDCKSQPGSKVVNYIGNHLEAIGYCKSPTGDGAAVVLEFKDIHRQTQTYLMSRGMLAGDGNEIVAALLDRSYWFVRCEKPRLLSYLQGLGGGIRAQFILSDKTGWVNGSFVLPHQTIGDEHLRFQNFEPPKDHPYQPKGTLGSWQKEVGQYATGNTRLVFGLSTAFAGPLLDPLDLQGGGFNFFGPTSRGKTTAVQVAASVSGHPDKVVRSWRATDNGLEGTAAEHNDLTLILDELKECHPKVVDQASYLLANGQGKQRANRTGGRQPAKTWRSLFTSTGEMPFVDYLKGNGSTPKGGQEIRIIDVAAIAGEHGVFENLHGFKDGAALSNHLKSATRQHHGTALVPFLEKLTSDIQANGIENLRQQFKEIREKLTPDVVADPAVGRAIERFAVVALAGELAIEFGVLPIAGGEPTTAAKALLQTWLDLRGGTGSHDINQALERVESILRENYHSGLVELDHSKDAKDSPRGAFLGYRKGNEILILPSIYRDQLCQGVDRKLLTQELIAKGWLTPGSHGKTLSAHWVEGKTQKFYQFSVFWEVKNV